MTKEDISKLFHSNEDVEDYIARYAVINHKPIDLCFEDAIVKEYCKYYISKGDHNDTNGNRVDTNRKQTSSYNCS